VRIGKGVWVVDRKSNSKGESDKALYGKSGFGGAGCKVFGNGGGPASCGRIINKVGKPAIDTVTAMSSPSISAEPKFAPLAALADAI
jgi:hypothetical protein